MPPFYKIKQSPESLRDTSWILCQEAKPGFKPRSDSQLPVLRNGDFFCLCNIFRHEPKHFQGIQCKKPENTKGEKSNSGESSSNSQLREARCGRGYCSWHCPLRSNGSGLQLPMSLWVGFLGGCGGEVETEPSRPAQEHGAALGAPGAQSLLPAKPVLSGEPGSRSGWDRAAALGEVEGLGERVG